MSHNTWVLVQLFFLLIDVLFSGGSGGSDGGGGGGEVVCVCATDILLTVALRAVVYLHEIRSDTVTFS